MQSLKEGDGTHLPHGLSVVNTYTKVTTRSKWVPVVVKNLMAIPITIVKGIAVTQVFDVFGKASNYLIFQNIYSTHGYMSSMCSTSDLLQRWYSE